ncbi:hypothetical protein GQ457_14G025360 [Hibiscus cannabinus]
MASSSSSPPMKYHVFLSFRGGDTRLNFTGHLLKELKAKGIKVFFDEDTLKKGELLSPALSQGIAYSRLSIIVLSSDYASSKSCLAELSDIMDRRRTHGQIVLPIFYHVDPSHVRHLDGSFKKSFDDHESKRLHQLQRWKTAFAKLGELKGWHIEGDKCDRPDTEYIEDVVKYVIKKLNSEPSTVSEDLVGIYDQKKEILGLIEQEESRVIGLWGMGGIGCLNLSKIPDLLRAINLKFLKCRWCESLVELPCLSHLTSLEELDLQSCSKLKKFPELPNNCTKLDISNTGIEEVSDSIEHLVRLESLNLSGTRVKNVPSNISNLESLQKLQVAICESLKSLPELPPYLCCLEAEDCTSLEKVSFANHNLYRSSSYCDVKDKRILLSFSNCFGLDEDSIKNIGAGAMLQIQSLAHRLVGDVICRFPGNEISANEFEHRSVDSFLNLEIAPNGCMGNRFFVFAICLVPDFPVLEFIAHGGFYRVVVDCKLTAISGEEFKRVCVFPDIGGNYDRDHVIILSSENLIMEDNDYKEASFDFTIKRCQEKTEVEDIKVKKCGVHVFYVDSESYADSDVESNEMSDFNEMNNNESDDSFYSADDSNFEVVNDDTQKKVHDDSTTKMGPAGDKRCFSYDGGEGDREPKRLK